MKQYQYENEAIFSIDHFKNQSVHKMYRKNIKSYLLTLCAQVIQDLRMTHLQLMEEGLFIQLDEHQQILEINDKRIANCIMCHPNYIDEKQWLEIEKIFEKELKKDYSIFENAIHMKKIIEVQEEFDSISTKLNIMDDKIIKVKI